MTMPLIIGVALALLASVALNAGYLVQHLGSQQTPDITIGRPIATLRSLLASRLWLLGSVAGMAGWGLHVGALSQAPLSLVQAFSAGGLALAVPLGAWVTHTRLTRRERGAIMLMGGALALLGIGAGGAGTARSRRWRSSRSSSSASSRRRDCRRCRPGRGARTCSASRPGALRQR